MAFVTSLSASKLFSSWTLSLQYKPQNLYMVASEFPQDFSVLVKLVSSLVLQTSFYPPTFVHSVPFYGISFFPFSAYWNFTLPLKLAQEMNLGYALVFHKFLNLLPSFWSLCPVLIPLLNYKLQKHASHFFEISLAPKFNIDTKYP